MKTENRIWIHDEKYAGCPAGEKLAALRGKMTEGIDLNQHDDIAWLLNLRGGDDPYTPVFDSFMHVEKDSAVLYIHTACADEDVRSYLSGLGVEIREYEAFEERENYSSLVTEMKNIKSDFEINSIRRLSIRDAVYLTKFIYALKKAVKDKDIYELDAVDMLEEIRRKDELYICPSFQTITGYGPHGAVIHYHAEEETNVKLEHHGLFVLDAGGQYLDGTTDVTRTIVLGPLTEEEKLHYTLVCMGTLRVLNAKLGEDKDSAFLDEMARRPLRDFGLDYNHGTGHGIGFLGQVHESPAGIRRIDAKNPYSFKGGEVISDEPGVYIEGSHGVRIENSIYCTGSGFENLTWVPLERDALDLSVMTAGDKEYFEKYQAKTIEILLPYLDEEEREWLKRQ